jgi:hypothetical protein
MPGHTKSCYYAALPHDIPPVHAYLKYDSNHNPIGWNFCSNSGDICSPTGSFVDIIYADFNNDQLNDVYVGYTNAKTTKCDNAVFGYPWYTSAHYASPRPPANMNPKCYWRAR